jgi:hypothetical protein
MFWKKSDQDQKGTKLSGPKDIPEFAKKQIVATKMIDADLLPFLKEVVKHREDNARIADVIIFDPEEAEAYELQKQNYETVKAVPDLIVAEGWLNESEKKAELSLKKSYQIPKYFSEQEILQQIEELKDPGSSIFFYSNAGPSAGGPLGRGCSVIKLNPNADGKKIKKYSVYGANVVNMKPTQKEMKVFDSDKPKEVAQWVAKMHKPRFC